MSSEPSRGAYFQQLAASYVDDYQKQLAAIVADEVYVQEIRAQVPPEEGALRSRTLRGEVFFLFAAAEREWMAIRDVKEVDGVPLTGTKGMFRATLRTLPAAQVADRMKSYNARYNIGRITRDINEPTLALLVLDATHRDRFRFKADKPRQAGDRRLVPLSFKERELMLIRSTAGKPIYTSGELLVEPESGRIWQSTLNASVDAIKVQLTTDTRSTIAGPAVADRVPGTIRAGNRDQRRGSGRPTITPDHEVVVAEGRDSNLPAFRAPSRVR